MSKNAQVIVFLSALIVTVVSVDVIFFRHHFKQRLIANIGIVLIYITFFFVFLKKR